MEEDIDEVLLKLTNKSVMHDKSNAKCNFTSTNNVVDLESESDDCCTSVSQRPVNPLSVLGTSASNGLPLPTVKMVTYDRFWQGQAERVANDNQEDLSELSSSVGTFSAESKKKHPVIFAEWCPILHNRKLQISGVTIDGNVDSRSIDRRISGYIFYDKSEVPCSLGGPMTLLNSQPKFIKHKFALGIPEDWVQVQSFWNRFEKLGSPDDFAWLSSTDLDTSDLTCTGYDQPVVASTKLTTSTPRNNTIGFCNITTDISRINAADEFRTSPRKVFPNTVNCAASRSMRKTYTSAALKKKMNKIRSMLKVTLMRECSKLTSFNELDELCDNDLSMSACNAEVPVDNAEPQSKPIASERNNEYLWQNKLREIKNLSKNNVNTPTTSQSKSTELPKSDNSVHNQVPINSNNSADSLKPTTNVFLNKSQFLTKNAGKDISSSKNSGSTSKTIIGNVSQKLHEYVAQNDNLSSEMSALCVSANQSSTGNSNEKKLLNNSAVLQVSVNSSKKLTPPISSGDDVRNYVPSHIFSKHRDSLTLLMDKNGLVNKSASSNSSEMDNLDVFPTNSDSVVISFHNVNEINVTSDVNTAHSVTNNSFDVSLSLKNTENTRNYKVLESEEPHLETSFDDSIFSIKCKKAPNTNEGKFNTPVYETAVNQDNQVVNQTTKVISSNQNSYQNNKEVTANVSSPHCDNNLNNTVRDQKMIRNRILFSSEFSDDDEENLDQLNKAANTNVEIPNTDKHVVTKIIEAKINTSNSDSSDDDGANAIQVTKTITQSSNVKSKFSAESSDSNETEESHVEIVTNAVVHSSVKTRVKRSQVSATVQDHQNANINKSGTRRNTKVIYEKSKAVYTSDHLEIISRAKELTDDRSTNRITNKIKSPEKRNRDNCSVERNGKKQAKGKKSHGTDEVTNQTIVQHSLMQFTEEIIRDQSVPEPKETPQSSKKRSNARREKGSIQNERSISTNLTLEPDVSLNNTTFSRRGRARCPTLPFWTGARFVTIGDETMVTNVSALNSSHKRLLTPQKQTTVDKRARTKTLDKSPVKVLQTKPMVLFSAAKTAETEQQSKNIANVRAGTSRNTKNPCGTSKNKTEKSPVRTPMNTKVNISSSNDNKSTSCVDNVQNSILIRNSPSRSRSKYNKVNVKSNTEDSSSEICTSPIPTREKQNPNKEPVKYQRSVSKKLFHDANTSAKCSSKSQKAKETVSLNKVRKYATKKVHSDTNIRIVKENGKRYCSPVKSQKTKDISSPVQHEADTNITILNDLYYSPVKSNKKIKLSSVDSGVEINSINYTDEGMDYDSCPLNKRNAKLKKHTAVQKASANTEIDINVDVATTGKSVNLQEEKINLQTSEIIRNKSETDGRNKSSMKRNAKTKQEKRSVDKGDTESLTLNSNNHTWDTSKVNFVKPKIKNRKSKKTAQKDEVNAQDMMVKQLRSRDVSLEIINNMSKTHGSSTNLKPRATVEPSTKMSVSKTLKPSPELNSPKKLIKTSKRETRDIVVPILSPKKSRETSDPSKSDSVSLSSTKSKRNRKRSAKTNKNGDNSVVQSPVANSKRDKQETLTNNEKNRSNELVIHEEPAKKSKKLKQNVTKEKNLTRNKADCVSSLPNSSKGSKQYNNMTDGGIDYDCSESNAQTAGKHKTNTTQTVDQLHDGYVNNKCITLVTRLSANEIEKFTKHKSPERQLQSKMNAGRSMNPTINGKISRSAEKNGHSSSKSRSSSKKPRKQSFGESFFGDPVKMPLMIKLKRKRQSKEKPSMNLAENSINPTNNVTRKSGKRKFFNESDWLNSKECLQTFENIVEPCRTQNFCIQVEENKHDYFDDDVISEVAALAKL